MQCKHGNINEIDDINKSFSRQFSLFLANNRY